MPSCMQMNFDSRFVEIQSDQPAEQADAADGIGGY